MKKRGFLSGSLRVASAVPLLAATAGATTPDYAVLSLDGSLLTYTAARPVIASTPGGQFAAVAMGNSGNYIVGDDRLHRVLRITPAGAITVVASDPTAQAQNEGLWGDGRRQR